jgi:hypothetical protein
VAAAAVGDPAGRLAAVIDTLRPTVTPITHLRLNPLARTPVDPTTNGVGTQIADFKPIATGALTKPLSDGDSISQLPLVGPAARAVAG